MIGDEAIFLDEVMGEAPDDLQCLIERGPDAGRRARRGRCGGRERHAGHAVATLRHASAVLRPAQVLAIGANYAAPPS